jgi:hypothetical protein
LLRELHIELPLCVPNLQWRLRVDALRDALLAQPLLRAFVTLQHYADDGAERSQQLELCALACRELPRTSVTLVQCEIAWA